MEKKRLVQAICLASVCWLGTPGHALAQTDTEAVRAEIQALKAELSELERLRERVRTLEERLEDAEGKLADTDASDGGSGDMSEQEVEEKARAVAKEEVEKEANSKLSFGGALRYQYVYRDTDSGGRDRAGDVVFDTFRLEADGEMNNLLFSAEYRWYRNTSFIHHGYVGYKFDDNLTVHAGVNQVPFGIQPYASHTYFFSTNYYVGLEDDYDTGIKALYSDGPWSHKFAFYKNDEWGNASSFGPDGGPDSRYSYDVTQDGNGNYETNQLNYRGAYTMEHGENSSTEFGGSVQYGQLYNNVLADDNGDHWAAALHMVGNYGPWELMLQGTRYEYDVDATPLYDGDGNLVGETPGAAFVNGGRAINMGAYGFDYNIPAEATSVIANLAYDMDVEWGPVSSVKLYTNNTYTWKDDDAYDNTIMNIVGVAFNAWPFYTYLDVVSSKNNPFVNPYQGGNALTNGFDNNRDTRFNINFGYYW